jgi:hypothetical protein
MVLGKIEKIVFEEINKQLNEKINDSILENFDSFYEEDCEFRLELIDELISLLEKEKQLIKFLTED